MSTTNTGGPAFPFTDPSSPREHPGMTLRDYFAAKAMAQLIAVYEPDSFDGNIHSCAESAYQYADAMLRAREVA